MNVRRTRIITAAATGLISALALTGMSAATADAAPAKAAKIVTCTPANTKSVLSPVSRPINHLLIKTTNTGKAPATPTVLLSSASTTRSRPSRSCGRACRRRSSR